MCWSRSAREVCVCPRHVLRVYVHVCFEFLITPCALRNRGIAFGCDLSSEPFARLRHFQGPV